jgi:uncharacterized protein Usg
VYGYLKKKCRHYLSYLIRNDLTTIKVIYFLPDYDHILQEFVFQQYDIVPEYPRLNKFISFWKDNIEARIHRIDYTSAYSEYRFIEKPISYT